MKFVKLFILCASFVLAPIVAMAQQTTLWSSETFTSVPQVSGVINNTSNPKNAVRVFITYENIDPSIATPGFRVVLEQEVAPSVWRVVAAQNEVIANENVAPKRIIILSPTFVATPGVDEFIDDGNGGTRISIFDGVAGGKMRIRLVGPDTTFSGITISAFADLYDR